MHVSALKHGQLFFDTYLGHEAAVTIVDIGAQNIKNRNGLLYTDFNRTVYDALANENILDMQGITEAVSKYFYSNGDSFDGLFVAPEHQDRFERLASDAIEYYEN